MPNIRIKVDVTKILKEHIFVGAKGKYIDITLIENRDGEDQYGNHYMAVQDLPKEVRESGVKNPILGNAKIMKPKAAPVSSAPAAAPASKALDDDLDVPF